MRSSRRIVTRVAAAALILTLTLLGSACSLRWPFWRHSPSPPLAQKPVTDGLQPETPVADQQPAVPPVQPAPVDGPAAGAAGGVIDRRNKIPIVTSAPSGWQHVALTFDAGWEYELTPKLLDLLDQAGIKATFFLRGAWVHDHPDLARDIAARGHEIESHSYTHPDMTKLTDDQVATELDKEEQAFNDILGIKPTFFRPPYGAWNKHLLELLAGHGFAASIMWTVDTLDWESPGVDKVVARATGAKDGSIILMHLGAAQTIDALPRVIAGLREQGLEPVTLKQLLGGSLESATSNGH